MFPRAIAMAALFGSWLLLQKPAAAQQPDASARAARVTGSAFTASSDDALLPSFPRAHQRTQLSAPADTLNAEHYQRREGVRVLAGFSLGVPEGVSAELHLEPMRQLRVGAGLSYNSVSLGPTLQLSWFPFNPWLLLRVSGGYFFEGDARHLVASSNTADQALLERVSYGFGSLRAGWEGHVGWVNVSVLAGVSYLRSPVHNVSVLLDANVNDDRTEIRVPEDPILSALFPSVQLGIVFGAPHPEPP